MARADIIRLLDIDPDLARDLEGDAVRHARERVVARVERIPAGRREGVWGFPGEGSLGLMIVNGIVLRQLVIGRSPCAELLGPPDLIRPWDHDGGVSLPVPARVEWELLEEAQVAVLDAGFVRRAAMWPPILAALSARGVLRAQTLAVHQAITRLNRVEDRLILLFWHLAERWGRVGPDGVMVDLPLTHDLLARLVGARRPSVTTALGHLRERQLVRRGPGRTWILHPDSAEEVGTPEQARLMAEGA